MKEKKNLGLIDHFVAEVFISINNQKKKCTKKQKTHDTL